MSITAFLTKMAEKGATHVETATGAGVVAEQVGVAYYSSNGEFDLLTMDDRYYDGEGDTPVWKLTPITQADSPRCSTCGDRGEVGEGLGVHRRWHPCPDCQTSA